MAIVSFLKWIATITQKTIYGSFKRKLFSKTPRLSHSFNFYNKRPNLKGIVSKVVTMSPKKPNSANRHVSKVTLTTQLKVTCRVPGKDKICAKFNRVFVEGGRANDLPGVNYSIKRGVYDFVGLLSKKKRRSIYGASRPDNVSKYIRRKNR